MAVVVGAMAGCGAADPPAATPAPSATAAPGTETAASVVPAAIDFAAPAVGGGEIDLRAYAGRDLALWFWAPY